MDFDGALHGLSVALTPTNLLFVFVGVLIGMVIGILPGLGPTATIALLLPLTFGIDPASAIIMLAGIYYGSMYGGTITSVLLSLPGEAASVVTTFDGHQMARQGRAGPALGIAAIGSFIGGVVSILGLAMVAPVLSAVALRFGPAEYTVIAVLGIILAAYLGTGTFTAAMLSASLGILFDAVGQDPVSASPRFTLGMPELLGGLDFVAVAMGLFGLGELLQMLEHRAKGELVTTSVGRVLPSRTDLKDCSGAIARGSVIGFFLGILPGGGGMISSLASYAVEKRRSKDPSRFGKGAIQGVAGPETANNAGSQSAFIPLLTLGIPPNSVLALILGGLLVQGVVPGPTMMNDHPDIFWGVIASMLVGNIILLCLNIPMVSVFIQILRIRVGILASIAVVVTMLGVFSINNSSFDLYVVLAFGVLGYLMRKVGLEPGPMVLAFVLGSLLEPAFRQTLLISGGDPSIFITRPISGSMLALSAIVALVLIVRGVRSGRRTSAAQTLPVELDHPMHHERQNTP